MTEEMDQETLNLLEDLEVETGETKKTDYFNERMEHTTRYTQC